ncbi:TetR/AcrR family transcriptional regulator [Actinoplanes sp. NPDC051494]|uniref:TetR/AcrR family transcriptional regulator n=1 Tax=Actinoplanes sp. NPDC051494 TaxID=3363907 RepID=UPI0037A9EA01
MRADALRKREAVLAAALEVFADKGVDVALDEIARRAGVGIATVYRHFPTREALIAGAYVKDIETFCESAAGLLDEMPADQAIETWLRRFIGLAVGRAGMAMALKSVVAATDPTALRTGHDRMFAALDELMAAARRDGLIQPEATSEDLAAALSGISLAHDEPGTEERAYRIITLTVNGLRYGSPRP